MEDLYLTFKELEKKHIDNVLELSEEGNTIPFIARYRKELTGSMDEVKIQEVLQEHKRLVQLDERRTTILNSIEEQGKLSAALKKKIYKASTLQTLEDLYLPYKKKRETKAVKAKNMGLEPLALQIMKGSLTTDVRNEAKNYINEELSSVDEVLLWVHEILADNMSENFELRQYLRKLMMYQSILISSVRKNAIDDRSVYQIYYDFSSDIKKLKPFQIMAINRAEKEKVLSVKIIIDEALYRKKVESMYLDDSMNEDVKLILKNAMDDAYKRFLHPSLEREIRNHLSEIAHKQSIKIFSENLEQMLLQAPIKKTTVCGFDPAFRTGCKLAAVDKQGVLLDTLVIYPHQENRRDKEKIRFAKFLKEHDCKVIALGNGTASRESEEFIVEVIDENKLDVKYTVVSEAGASVYSASEVARREFPELEVEMRSAISIARRIQDPLAELVKIDPKSIGVGQYQHDLPQKDLEEALNFTVEKVVNRVGVDVNTASVELLMHVSGLSKRTAQNLFDYRIKKERIINRNEIKNVKGFGPKTYEQSIGFLRVFGGDEVLDETPVHPESYDLAYRIMKDHLKDVDDRTETIRDIKEALKNRGRDIRENMESFILKESMLKLEDLKEGMIVEGVVRNIVDFGAFIDLGVGEDALLHISEISNEFVRHPSEKLALNDRLKLEVIGVDLLRKRIQVSLKSKV